MRVKKDLKARLITAPGIPDINEETVKEIFPGFCSSIFNSDEYLILPGFCDVHVHFREPGFSYKETIKTGSLAAASGGYTDVCTMPNTYPVQDSPENLRMQLDIIKKDAVIGVHPYAAITVGEKGLELTDMDVLSDMCVAFSDDGKGVQSEEMMRKAMLKCASLGKVLSAHCEVNELLRGGYIHDGKYAKYHGHKGICSESEWKQIERDVKIAKETGCRYHVCHISCKESVEIIRRAKKEGADVTCETAPHYLVLTENDLKDEGRFKMNPPLRSEEDRQALIEGIKDGTIDMIATDHAPHSAEEKSKGLSGSAVGITGLETAFPVIYTYLVLPGIISLENAVRLMCAEPRKRFGLPLGRSFSIWNTSVQYTLDPAKFISKGKATPFEGSKLYGICEMTFRNGTKVFDRKEQ
ncbi:MAG: dihydroorotase [Firmicutes bacterium]|nr:dihydroorotase [Bacillota bacterium]